METRETMMHYATDFENITIELGELEALLQLYAEHREEELEFLTAGGEPTGFVKMYLDRDRMADALLAAIYDKARATRSNAEQSATEAFRKAQENR